MSEALIGLAALLLLSFLRVPVAFSMLLVGALGMTYAVNFTAAMANIGQTAYDAAVNYELSVMPLFVLMGNFITRAKLSDELYAASYAFLGHRRGGLSMATIVACAGFGAVCGSSMATAATMAGVAMPSMRRYGYGDSLAVGAIAAGGTLGILIPPSVVLVLYGIMTQTSIGKLFIAGILPGIIATLFYLFAVRAVIAVKPELGPPGERFTWAQRLEALKGVWGVGVLFLIVMGGIYGGIFTPTEAAGIGAAGGFLFFLGKKETPAALLRHVVVISTAGALLVTALAAVSLLAGLDRDPVVTVIVLGVLVLAAAFARTAAIRAGHKQWIVGASRAALTLFAAMAGGVLLLALVGAGGDLGDSLHCLGRNPLPIAAAALVCGTMVRLTRSTGSVAEISETLLESASTVAGLFTVLIGALIFANFINYTTFPQTLLEIAQRFSESPWLLLAAILFIYILLGSVFESLSMILLTVPIFFPVIVELAPGFGLTGAEAAIWFGILVVVVTEIGLITPPVGLNVFVLRGVLHDVSTTTMFRGVAPFVIADFLRIAVIAGIPALSLWFTTFVR